MVGYDLSLMDEKVNSSIGRISLTEGVEVGRKLTCIGGAIELIKSGSKVLRRSWCNDKIRLKMYRWLDMSNDYELLISCPEGTVKHWTPDHSDLLGKDWSEVWIKKWTERCPMCQSDVAVESGRCGKCPNCDEAYFWVENDGDVHRNIARKIIWVEEEIRRRRRK